MPAVTARIRMGIVGAGFVGVHHVDAVRRLGFVEIDGVAAGSPESARQKAGMLGARRSFDDWESLVADPGIDVVHIAAPNHLHVPIAAAALSRGKHVVCDKPLAPTAAGAHALWDAARGSDRVAAVTFNYRGSALVQHARVLIAEGEAGPLHYVHGAYLQDWLLKPTDFSWRLEPDKGGESSAMADIGSHWCDLIEHVTHLRIEAVLADLSTVVARRQRGPDGEAFVVRGEDLATVLIRFAGGARGCVSIGQVCAGHKNDLWFEASGQKASLRWHQERQNELWIGRREGGATVLPNDPVQLAPAARSYARLPGGHQEGWSDAFFNVIRDIYTVIAAGPGARVPLPRTFATFEDGYRAASIVDAVLDSHRRGGVWVGVAAPVFAGSGR
jgi:predicted dehydrogenase